MDELCWHLRSEAYALMGRMSRVAHSAVHLFSGGLRQGTQAFVAFSRPEVVLCASQSSHGFTSSSKWAERIGAFINLESTGSAGVFLLCSLLTASAHTREVWRRHMVHAGASHTLAQQRRWSMMPSRVMVSALMQ